MASVGEPLGDLQCARPPDNMSQALGNKQTRRFLCASASYLCEDLRLARSSGAVYERLARGVCTIRIGSEVLTLPQEGDNLQSNETQNGGG